MATYGVPRFFKIDPVDDVPSLKNQFAFYILAKPTTSRFVFLTVNRNTHKKTVPVSVPSFSMYPIFKLLVA